MSVELSNFDSSQRAPEAKANSLVGSHPDGLLPGSERVLSAHIAEDIGETVLAGYFHGSDKELQIGTVLTPGYNPVKDEEGTPQVSATRSEREAWGYAEMRSEEDVPPGGFPARPKVYKVIPTSGMPPRHLGPLPFEVNSPSFTVVGRYDTKPGRQGTIPNINWSEYLPYVGVNHPEADLWQPEPAQQPDSPLSPADVPLPGLEEDYVRANRQRSEYAPPEPPPGVRF